RLKLRIAQSEDRRTRSRQKASARVAGAVGIEQRVVTDHHHAIPGHRTIELHGGHAELHRTSKPGEGIFGPYRPCAAVTLQVKHEACAWARRSDDTRTGRCIRSSRLSARPHSS